MILKEHFCGGLPLKAMTGAFMTERSLLKLERTSLLVENLHGQGYDNGRAIKGKGNGVHK